MGPKPVVPAYSMRDLCRALSVVRNGRISRKTDELMPKNNGCTKDKGTNAQRVSAAGLELRSGHRRGERRDRRVREFRLMLRSKTFGGACEGPRPGCGDQIEHLDPVGQRIVGNRKGGSWMVSCYERLHRAGGARVKTIDAVRDVCGRGA